MKRQIQVSLVWLVAGLTLLTGCTPTQPFFLHEDGDLSHYLDSVQTTAAYPDVETADTPEATMAIEPLTVLDPEFDDWWDLSLEEVIALTLHNSKVIRNVGQVSQFGIADGLLSRTATAPTVHDPAISATNASNRPNIGSNTPGSVGAVGTGSRGIDPEQFSTANTVGGVEDALAAFDTQFAAVFGYDHQDIQNNLAIGNIFTSTVNSRSIADASLTKRLATGGSVGLKHRVEYSRNDASSRAVPSDYTAIIQARVDHPLLRGRGAFINRIPVILARINEDISVAAFEIAVRNQLLDVENTYWDLQCAYRNFETAKQGRDAVQRTWQRAFEKAKVTGGVQQEAQSREQYLFFRAQLESSLATLLETEARLRWLMGLAPTDGRLVRPIDDPTIADVSFDFNEIRTEALYRNAELRQQKWRIKQRELELANARHLLLPALNLFAQHQWHGVGDEYVTADRRGLDFAAVGSTAWDNLTDGDQQSSFVGLEFLPPAFGARREHARIRNSEIGLQREEDRLEDMELQSVHLLSTALRNKALNYRQITTHLNRWAAANQEIKSALAAEAGGGGVKVFGRPTTDVLLDAQRRRALAQSDYFRVVCEYNKAIADVHFRKGTLLQYSGIRLAEGPWPDKAYWDAIEKARQRDASHYLNYGYTRPGVVSRGPMDGEIIGTPIPDGVIVPELNALPSDREVIPPGERQPNGLSPMDTVPMNQAPMNTAPMEPAKPAPAATPGPNAETAGGASVLRTSGASPYQWGDLGLGSQKPTDAAKAAAPTVELTRPQVNNPLR